MLSRRSLLKGLAASSSAIAVGALVPGVGEAIANASDVAARPTVAVFMSTPGGSSAYEDFFLRQQRMMSAALGLSEEFFRDIWPVSR